MPTKDKAKPGVPDGAAKIPGPSPDPATNILIASVAMLVAGELFHRSMEKGLRRMKFPPETARQIIASRTLIAAGLARIAPRSGPGALLVTGGLLAKSSLDRSRARRGPGRRRKRQIEQRAENAD